MSELSPRQKFERKKRRQRLTIILAVIILIAAWFFGYFNTGSNVKPLLQKVLPQAEEIQKQGNIFIGYDAEGEIAGYAAVSQSAGYGGPIEMLVALDPQGKIIGYRVINHRETPGFFRLLPENRFFKQFLGMDYTNQFQLGGDIDAVSGATISCEGVARAVREAVYTTARAELNQTVPPAPLSVQFGIPEFALISLYGIGFFAHQMKNKRLQRKIRWGTLLVGAILLGFIYNKSLTIANFISLLSGYWPNWQTNLYWYLLLGGVLFVSTTEGKNSYCHWFCPFGSVQEILSTLTNAKVYRPRKYRLILLWLQRGMAFFALVLGLALRMPGPASPEPFGTLFNLTGNWPQFVLLIGILLVSLVIYRPFCSYLCPIDPTVDFVVECRRWIISLWKNVLKISKG